ncbi:uncharacterized protein LOC122638984 [Telopea speciosissima]|uniref:uncharacterized protein LOC122638984 n=1 Tax=Telopea speciosissima TaxID=54955 RepID=UPI001CC3E34C|nr:uncharacterized protein LOC122638984 [Telopea speciosissima]
MVTTVKPSEAGALQDKWSSSNSLFMAFLLNAMIPFIAHGYTLLDSAVKIWKAAKGTYSQVGNDAQVFDIQRKIHATTQGELTLSEYYCELRSLWQELDYYDNFQLDCPSDITKFQLREDKFRVYTFLTGLNVEYDQLRSQVLSRSPFSTLEQAYFMIQLADTRHSTMLPTTQPERSALISSRGNSSSTSTRSSFEKEPLKCTHCGKERHTVDFCWKLHGRPSDSSDGRSGGRGRGRGRDRGGRGGTQAHLSEAIETAPTTTLSVEELVAFRRMMTTFASSSVPTSTSTVVPSSKSNLVFSKPGYEVNEDESVYKLFILNEHDVNVINLYDYDLNVDEQSTYTYNQ